MKLLIIRHGESEADLLKVHEGRADFALTGKGHRQADAMAEYVRCHYRVARLYSSTLKRAAQTAGHLSAAADVPVMLDELLMEFNNGLLAGLPWKEAAEKYPTVRDLPVDQAVYGQESKLDFRNRAEAALTRILTESRADEVTAVITHGGMINQLYHAALHLPIVSACFFGTGDTGIHEWEIKDDGVRIIRANYCGHTEGL
ncbi:MAG: histidine phosphatase family protein [Clostridia bacterium]|nr:histidine phosphatase family protein [Clostridia bacterium]